MATVRASCPECGDVELTTKDVTCISIEYPTGREVGQYRFRCPIDRKIVVKEAVPHTIDLLVASGVELKVIELNEQKIPNVPGNMADEYLDALDNWSPEQFDTEIKRLENDN